MHLTRMATAWIVASATAAVAFGGCLIGMNRLTADSERIWSDSHSEGIRHVQMLSILGTVAGLALEMRQGEWAVQSSPEGFMVSRGGRTRLASVVPFPGWLQQDKPLPELRIGQSGAPEVTLETKEDATSVCGTMLKTAAWEMPNLTVFEMGTVGMEGLWRWQRIDRSLVYSQAEAVCGEPAFRDTRKLWFRLIRD